MSPVTVSVIQILVALVLTGLTSCTLHPVPQERQLTASDLSEFVIHEIHLIFLNISDPVWLFTSNNGRAKLDTQLVDFYLDMGTAFDRLARYRVLPQHIMDYSYSWRVMTMLDQMVESYYKRYQSQLHRTDYNLWKKSWTDLAMSILYDKNSGTLTSVLHILDNLHNVLVDKDNFYLDVYKELETSICSTEMSPQQLIYNLYSTLQITQLKAFVMMQFAHNLLHIYGKGDFSHETAVMQEQFKSRLLQQLATAKSAMGQADSVVYKCDPKTHVDGQSYTQLTMLLQGFIVNEVDLNGKESCTDNCAAYPYSRQYGCFDNQFCARQSPCEGNLLNCRFYDSDMSICPSMSNPNSTRRYEWIQYENGVTLGKKSHCRNFEDKVDSWWRFVFHCSYCMCLCDAKHSPLSHRYWSLRPVESDIANNKVIVGLRFVKQSRVIHLQIRQATLLGKLLIDSDSAEWLSVPPMEVKDTKTVEGLDYHKMTFEKRALDLDDLRVGSGSVLTGVRFRILGNHLNLEIRETPFDYKTGQLAERKSQWLGNDNTDANMEDPRTLLDLENLDTPLASSTPSIPDSSHDTYLRFTNSDLSRDVGQTTVPFIDIQPVTSDPLSPLAGAGIYHKGVPGYGGFVAPKVFTINVADYLAPPGVGGEK